MPKLTNLLVLLLPFSAAVFWSCTQNEAVRHRYAAEKKFHEAEKLLGNARIRPELGTSEQMEQIRSRYQGVLVYTMNALEEVDSSSHPVEFAQLGTIAHRSTLRLAGLLHSDRQYDSCIALFGTLLNKTRLSSPEMMSAYVLLGQSIQASGNWDSAVSVYTYALDNYYPPVDEAGEVVLSLFNVPLLLFRVSSFTGDTIRAAQYKERAENYYRGLIDEYPGSNMAVASHGNLARLYYDGQDWRNSIAHLNELVDSTGATLVESRIRIADIYGAYLGRLDSALAQYDDIMEDLTGRDTLVKPLIMYKKSLVYLEQGDYVRCRRILGQLQDDYPAYYNYQPTAQYVKARAFELEGNWDRAETEYKYLIEQYDGSDEAMTVHMYLARQLADMGRTAESELWYDRAEKYFDKVALRGKGTEREGRALMYKAELYRTLREWNKAAGVLAEIFEKYPDTEVGRNALLTAAGLYRRRLDNPVVADSLLEVYKSAVTKPLDDWGT
jgi:tetratricopeptide (TPR) repeat protein